MTANQGIAIKVGTRVRLVSCNARLNGQEVTLTGINQDAAFPYEIRLDDGTKSRVAEREIVGGARAALAVDPTEQMTADHYAKVTDQAGAAGWATFKPDEYWDGAEKSSKKSAAWAAALTSIYQTRAQAPLPSDPHVDNSAFVEAFKEFERGHEDSGWNSQIFAGTGDGKVRLRTAFGDIPLSASGVKSIDPLDVEYDGFRLRELLDRDTACRQETGEALNRLRMAWTPAQRSAVSAHWSAELRAKVQASAKTDAERERLQVVVDMEVE